MLVRVIILPPDGGRSGALTEPLRHHFGRVWPQFKTSFFEELERRSMMGEA